MKVSQRKEKYMIQPAPKALENEDIFTMANVQELRKLFMEEEEHLVIWYDQNINSNLEKVSQIKQICPITTFTDLTQLFNFLDTNDVPCQIITSGADGESIAKHTEPNALISQIYVYCRNSDYHKTWADNYSKVSCVETVFSEIMKRLKQDLTVWKRKNSFPRFDLPVFTPVFDDSDKSKQNYLHVLLRGFVQFQDRSKAKTDFINLAKEIAYSEKDKVDIKTFEEQYNQFSMESVLNWYTRECFYYKLTNNCLRVATPDSIQYSRLVLKDVESAIKKKHQKDSHKFKGLVFRGTRISSNEWNLLQQNVGKEIEMYGFLSTSKSKSRAELFCKGLFITIIVPGAPDLGEQGFAEVEEYTAVKGEDEVLFNVRSVFNILEAGTCVVQGRQCYHLTLLYGANAMKRYLSLQNPVVKLRLTYKSQYICNWCNGKIKLSKKESKIQFFVNLVDHEEYLCRKCLKKSDLKGSTPLFGILASDMSQKGTEKVFEIPGFVVEHRENQKKIPFYGYKCRHFIEKCKDNQEELKKHSKDVNYWYKCLDCKERNISCRPCFGKNKECVKARHLIVLEKSPFTFWSEKMSQNQINHLEFQEKLLSNLQQVDIFNHTHNYKKAIEYYNKYLEENKGMNPEKRANIFHKLGLAYRSLSEYDKAIDSHLHAIELQQKIFSADHLELADSYHAIGEVYNQCKKDKDSQAVEYLTKALDIKKKTLDEKHPSVADSMCSLGLAYAFVFEDQKALELQLKALEVRKSVFNEIHPATATSYRALGLVYLKSEDFQKALEHFQTSHKAFRVLYGDIHPEVARSCHNLGVVYERLEKFGTVLEAHCKSLEIRREIFGEKHAMTAVSYNAVGIAYERLKKLDKALEYYLKCLEIRKEIFGDKHVDTAASYERVGIAYNNLNRKAEAYEYFSTYCEISKALFGKKDPRTVLAVRRVKNMSCCCNVF